VNLDDPATTLALLKLDAVVGVKGLFDSRGELSSMGVTCALCHSTVDDSFAPGIGRRLDGWANRDLRCWRDHISGAQLKGGFYHDGRFAALRDVLEHYDQFFRLGLTEPETTELAEYLKSL
jgi:hypothetical protein